MAAVLLVFQYGQPRIFYAMARDGLLPQWAARLHPRTRIPYITTLATGIFVGVWALIGDAAETYDLTNIGTLFAFMLVSLGVLILRYKEPNRPRPFRVPFVWPVSLLSAAACIFIMYGLPGVPAPVPLLARLRRRRVRALRLPPQPAAHETLTSATFRARYFAFHGLNALSRPFMAGASDGKCRVITSIIVVSSTQSMPCFV